MLQQSLLGPGWFVIYRQLQDNMGSRIKSGSLRRLPAQFAATLKSKRAAPENSGAIAFALTRVLDLQPRGHLTGSPIRPRKRRLKVWTRRIDLAQQTCFQLQNFFWFFCCAIVSLLVIGREMV